MNTSQKCDLLLGSLFLIVPNSCTQLVSKLFFVFIIIISGCISKENGEVGTIAPQFKVTDLEGQEYSLDEMEGKVVVLNFWFIKCPPCIREIPELNGLVEKYQNSDVVFLAIATDSKASLKVFLKDRRFNYHIVSRGKWMTKLFRTHGFPTNIIIDSKSEIVFHKAAFSEDRVRTMDSILFDLLN